METTEQEQTDFLEKALSVIYKPETQSLNIGNINNWIRSSQSRWIGLSSMNIVLNRCHANSIVDYGIQWIKITSEISILSYESDAIRNIAAENFCKLFEFSSQIPEVAREIPATVVVNILQDLLSADVKVLESALKCLTAILKYLPGPCGMFKGKICKFVVPLLADVNSTIRDRAIDCWCYVPILGGGGTKRKNHVIQWQDQFKEVMGTLSYTKAIFFDGEEDLSDPSYSNLSLHLPPLPVNEPQLSLTLVQRFVGLSKCVEKLLKLNFKLPVEIPVQQVIELLFSCLDVTPKSMGITSEKQIRSSYLKTVHSSCLTLLQSVISSCGQYVCRHNSSFCQLFDNLLHLWKDLSPIMGMDKKHLPIRVLIYETILHWLKNCGTQTNFLCGQNHTVNSLLQHLVEDIKPIPDHFKMTENSVSNNNKTRNKKKKSMNVVSENTCVRIIKSNANSKLCTSALKVLRLTVFTFGPRLSVNVHKTLQENVITLLLKLKQGASDLIPYASCEDSRKELYHLLLALTSNPSVAWPSPIQFTTQLLSHGANRDDSLKVKMFCVEASVTVGNMIHPRAPSMQRVAKNFSEDCKKKWLEDNKNQVNFYIEMRERNTNINQQQSNDLNLIKEPNNLTFSQDSLKVTEDIDEVSVVENDDNSTENVTCDTETYIIDKENDGIDLCAENGGAVSEDEKENGFTSRENDGSNQENDDLSEFPNNCLNKNDLTNPTVVLENILLEKSEADESIDITLRGQKRKVDDSQELEAETVGKIIKTDSVEDTNASDEGITEDLESMLEDFNDSAPDLES